MKNLSPKSIGGSPSHCICMKMLMRRLKKQYLLARKVLDQVTDQFWGDRHGRLEDPFGHQWNIATHIKDLSEEEMKKVARRGILQNVKVNSRLKYEILNIH